MRISRGFMALAMCAAGALVHAPATGFQVAPEDPEVRAHVERARNLGRDEFAFLWRRYCRAGGAFANDEGKAERAGMELPATRVFDNLFYVGTAEVGAWIVKTSSGLILIDALNDPEEAQKYVLDGMRALGLDPSDLKKIIVTHAHGDHFGGAKFLKEKTGARIFMSGDDWNYLDTQKSNASAPPRWAGSEPDRDGLVSDGEIVSLGDTSITFYQTPGHTPGTLSALIPLRDGAASHMGALWGGTAFPRTNSGLRTYERSLMRFWGLANQAKVDVLLSNHPFLDNGLDHIRTMSSRKAGEPNPFVIGGARYATFMGTLSECNLAAQRRLQATE